MASSRRASLLSGIAWTACIGLAPAVALAQQEPAAEGESGPPEENVEILVLAERLHGQVEAPQPPLQVLGEEDIAAYGAGSLAELLQQLAPQTTSGRGRGAGFPALLVNGMRVSSFREIQAYPPEAIRRIEILPEEVALRYGFSADQRVVNIILKDDYRSAEVEMEYGQPGSGGYRAGELETTFLRIDGSNRLNLNADLSRSGALTELERRIIQPESLIPTVAGDPDPAAQRLLREPETNFAFNATSTMGIGSSGGSLALNAAVERDRRQGRDGYTIVLLTAPDASSERRVVNPDDVLTELNKSTTWSAGATLNHPLGRWDLTATMDGSIARSSVLTDRALDVAGLVADALAGVIAIDGPLPLLPDAGTDLARSTTRTLNSLATARGALLWLPAGDVSATFRAGYNIIDFDSSDTRNPGLDTALRRNTLTAGGNIGIPLTSRRENVLSAVGDIALNFSAGLSDLSDFGTLKDWSAGVNWAPTERLNLQATYLYDENAPSLTQLGSPTVVRQNVAVYDFSGNRTALVETLSGGNPALRKEVRKDWRFSAQWALPFYDDASLQVEYFHNRSHDIASGFPAILTPDIEAAFPDRVTRDGGGTLLALDIRPVTFERQVSRRIRWGINFGGPLGKARPPAAGGSISGGGAFAGQAGQGGQSGPPGAGGGPGQGGAFNPAAFQALRARLCAEGQAEGELDPQILAAMPEPLRARLNREDGSLDPERVKEFRNRICNANPALFPGGPGQGGGQPFDPARFAAIRQRICAAQSEEIPDLSDLPEPMLAQIRGPDGAIDPDRYREFKTRFCSFVPANPAGGGQQVQGQGGAPGQGPGFGFFRFGGPPGGGPGGPGGGPGGSGGAGGFGPGGGGPPVGAILRRAGGGGDGRGRFFVNLFHTIELKNELLIATGIPVLDLLDGDALSGAGTVRHSLQLEGGMFYRGMGLRLSGRYSGPSRVEGSGLPGSTDLHFGSLATLDLRMFMDLGQQQAFAEKHPFFKGSRIALAVNNLFDAQRRVTDSTGAVPLRYQPDLLDPVGRYFEIEFRKLF